MYFKKNIFFTCFIFFRRKMTANDFPMIFYHWDEDYIYDGVTVYMDKKNYVDFFAQYVKQVVGFSSQYGSDYSISYTAANIIGPPNKFPKYGDFPETFTTVCIFPSAIFIVL